MVVLVLHGGTGDFLSGVPAVSLARGGDVTASGAARALVAAQASAMLAVSREKGRSLGRMPGRGSCLS
ncbi:hypothetical protein RAA17_11445 [Komagataeibacter rhaeticus]|nr:hypothetical protein [Komagataeibacter rhaeticus]